MPQALKVFTTRADTLLGVTYVAVAAEHPVALYAAKSNPELAEFIEACKHGATMEAELASQEKKGMQTGLFVLHPLTGQAAGMDRQLRSDGLRRRRRNGCACPR